MAEKFQKTEVASRTVLGIDPGTGRCGWAMLEAGSRKLEAIKLINCGLIKTPAKTPLPERLSYIYRQITKTIRKYRPTELAIEEIFFVKNIKTGISVAHARGVVILAAKEAGLEIYEYKPNEVKMAIVGYGHATKEQIAKMLELHLKGCKIKQDDTADAVAVGLCHLQSSRRLKA